MAVGEDHHDGARCSTVQVGRRWRCGAEPTLQARLFPWLTLTDNVAFGLPARTTQRARDPVRETLDVVGLGAFANALPKQLAGGMAQRAALARAL